MKKIMNLLLSFFLIMASFHLPMMQGEKIEATSNYVNLALGKNVVVSGVEKNTTFTGDYIVDGVVPKDISAPTTSENKLRWSSNEGLNETPVWAYIDLETPQSFSQITIYWQKVDGTDYDIQISNDASDWETIQTITAEVNQVGRIDEVSFDEAKTARYVRIYIRKGILEVRSDVKVASIFEVEILQAGKSYANGDNIAFNKPTYASGSEVTKFSPDKAVDGYYPINLSVHDSTAQYYANRWSSNLALDNEPVWIYVDLEEVKPIHEIRLLWHKCKGSIYQIEISDDASEWSILEQVNMEVESSKPRVDSFVYDAPIEARYVKIYVTKGSGYENAALFEIEIFEAIEAVETDNLAYNKPVYSSGNEVDYMGPELAVDGLIVSDMTTHNIKDPNYMSRWSSSTTLDETSVWMYVDLQKNETISEVDIYWHKCKASEYQIQISSDASDWETIKTLSYPVESGTPRLDQVVLDQSVTTRYVRIYITKGNGEHKNAAIYELEIYEDIIYEPSQEEVDKAAVEELLKASQVTIANHQVVLPTYDGYTFSLYGSDNQQVIDLNGNIYQPLEDMNVNLILQATNNQTNEVMIANKNAAVLVKGSEGSQEEVNAKPKVLPAIREWQGDVGSFVLQDGMSIGYLDASVKESAEMIQSYFDEMLYIQVNITETEEANLLLNLDQTRTDLGTEGYYIEINDQITVTAPTVIGLLYGGITLTQIAYQNDHQIVKGKIRDYPMYETRAIMLDVGRMYFPIEYVEEISKYLSWYKINEIHLGTNNSRVQTGYTAFRLEIDDERIQPIVSKDGSYSKEAYKAFQQNVQKYGIHVITEIDTPAHSGAFVHIDDGALMMDFNHLDLRTPEKYEAAISTVKTIMDEYLGESVNDPNRIIQENVFHIGTDEYPTSLEAQFKNYTADLINYVTNKGYEVRLWGSLKNFDNPDNPIDSSKATLNQWSQNWATAKDSLDHGFNIINTLYNYLYIVPGLKGYPTYLPLESRYSNWSVTNYGAETLLKGEPKNVGAEFCLWMDTSSYNGGFSWFDAFDRMKNGVMLISEKTWYGDKTADQNVNEFMDRVEAFGTYTPMANPARKVKNIDKQVLHYDFEEVNDTLVKDLSENHYDGQLQDSAKVENGTLVFDGTGTLKTPITSIGEDYTIAFDVYMDEDCPNNAELLSSSDGTLYVNLNGNIGFKRQYSELTGYSFEFDYQLPSNTWTHLAITKDYENTYLIVDGKTRYIAMNKHQNITSDNNKIQEIDSTTFVAGLEQIGNHFKGQIDNIIVVDYTCDLNNIGSIFGEDILRDNGNLAYQKTAVSSGNEVDYMGPELAVDGLIVSDMTTHNTNDPNYMSRWSSSTTLDETPVWIYVDLEKVTNFSDIKLYWHKCIGSEYEIQISDDAIDWNRIGSYQYDVECTTPRLDEIHFDSLKSARYVRIYITKGCGEYKNAALYEIEIFNLLTEGVKSILNDEAYALYQEAQTLLNETKEGWVLNGAYQQLETVLAAINQYLEAEDTYNLSRSFSSLRSAVNTFKANIEEVNDTALETLINEAKNVETTLLEEVSKNMLESEVSKAEALMNDDKTTQEQVDLQVESLQNVLLNLHYLPADYTSVEEAISQANMMKTQVADFTSIQVAIDAVVYEKDIREQASVDAYAQAIYVAMEQAIYLPQKVTTLVAQAMNYKTIQLTWDVEEDIQYDVYRQNTKTGSWILLTSTTEGSYTLNGVKTGKEYTFYVVGKKTINGNVYKGEASALVKASTMLEGNPILTISANGYSKFDLSWEAVEGATRYIIYRKSSTSEYKKVLTLGKDVRTYTSASLLPGTYTYMVKAARYDSVDRVMTSGSNEVVAQSTYEPLTLSITKESDDSVSLTWNAAYGLKYYEVYRSYNNGVMRRFKVTSSTTLNNHSLKVGTYTYKVRGYRVLNADKVYSAYSNEESVTIE